MCGAGTHTSTYSDEFLGKKFFAEIFYPAVYPNIWQTHILMLVFLTEYAVTVYAELRIRDWVLTWKNMRHHKYAFHTWLFFCTVVSTFGGLEENLMYDSAISNIFRAYKIKESEIRLIFYSLYFIIRKTKVLKVLSNFYRIKRVFKSVQPYNHTKSQSYLPWGYHLILWF